MDKNAARVISSKSVLGEFGTTQSFPCNDPKVGGTVTPDSIVEQQAINKKAC